MVDRRHLLALGTGLGAAMLMPGAAAAATPDPALLKRRLAAGREAFRSARYADLAERLPGLRRDTIAAQQALTGSPGRVALTLVAHVHITLQ